jgi:hypothetical protein
MIRTYQCNGGGEGEPHRFEVMLAPGKHPRFCLECGAEVDPASLPVPARIAIGGSAIARATDETYRLLEQSTAARAAELHAPSLKVTDLKDNLREGDVAAKVAPNAVTTFAAEAKERFGIDYMQWGGGLGGRVAPAMPAGVSGQRYAGPGHVAMAALQPEHEGRVREVVARPTHRPYRG